MDPASRSIEVFRLEAGAYPGAGWFREAATLVSPSFPSLEVPRTDIFRPDR